MSQASPIVGAGLSGLIYRQQDNDGKKALLNHHKGASAPTYTEAGVIWLDDAATPWLLKCSDGSDWITLAAINASDNTANIYQGTAALRILNHATDTGATNAYAVAPVPAVAAYGAGLIVFLKPANTNTGATTVAVNGLAAKNIKMPDGTATPAGSMRSTGFYVLIYDGTNFVLTNPTPTSSLLLARGTTLASASVVDLGAADSDYVEISGTTTIASFGGTTTRNHVWVKFQGALTLTHNATSLILPTGTSIVTAAGDVAEFVRISGSNWQCLTYARSSGQMLAGISSSDLPDGAVVDSGYAQYTAATSLTALLRLDGTVPLSTEGTQVLSVSITPKSVTNKIRASFSGIGFPSATGVFSVAAMFVGTTCVNGAYARSSNNTAGFPSVLSMQYEYTPGSTSPVTISVRAGPYASGSMQLNDNSMAAGTTKATLLVQEIKA